MDAIVEGNFFPEMTEQRATIFTASSSQHNLLTQPSVDKSESGFANAPDSKPVQMYRTSSRGDRELMAFHAIKRETNGEETK